MKILKFDTINPEIYLLEKIRENEKKISGLSKKEYLDWILSLRSNFSDFYTYNLKNLGWEAEEFIITDSYLEKTAEELYGSTNTMKKMTENLKDMMRPIKARWKRRILVDYVKSYKPDVIFVREITGIPSSFWRFFQDRSLIVSRLAASLPNDWSPLDWDLIYTSTETFRKFFKINKVDSIINENGFDERILTELRDNGKKHNITFVGGLGNRYWKHRTKCAEYLSDNTDFKWWGIKGSDIKEESSLSRTYQGILSGLEMLQLYKDSKIVFNDYGEIAEGEAVNQRMFEVMGVGSLLLTREAENISGVFPEGTLVTFKDERDCAEKINYYLKNDKEREEIALKGQEFVLKNFNYKDIMRELDSVLKNSFLKKFSSIKSRW